MIKVVTAADRVLVTLAVGVAAATTVMQAMSANECRER